MPTPIFYKRKKRLGQVFLVNGGIAIAEAVHGLGKNVLELGPGKGILTKELCNNAKKVVAVEKDSGLYTLLKHEIKSKNLILINKDFFKATEDEIGLKDTDIMISNIPYNLSSKTIEWLSRKRMQAVLCLQKEFVDHMLAKPDTRNYSKLSVMTSLMFRVVRIMDVKRGNFRPVPKVDSVIVYIKPKGAEIPESTLSIIGFLMQHKKKTLRNALLDSASSIKAERKRLLQIADSLEKKGERVFKLSPEEILKTAEKISESLK
jgi:16S rRNA (adenine1518-N6/adenine1519-N6)-dimethyltransferase